MFIQSRNELSQVFIGFGEIHRNFVYAFSPPYQVVREESLAKTGSIRQIVDHSMSFKNSQLVKR